MRQLEYDYLTTQLRCSLILENERLISAVCSGPSITDAVLALIEGETSIGHLDLTESNVTDNGLTILQRFPMLESLRLRSTQVTGECLKWVNPDSIRYLYLDYCPNLRDECLAPVSRFKKLERLILGFTNISNAGLAHLGELPHLWVLGLECTNCDDDGLKYLHNMPSLAGLREDGSRITPQGRQKLRNFLPRLSDGSRM